MSKEFVRFDEIEDVLVSVELVHRVTLDLSKQPSLWKWAIVAAHAALQGSMVCVVSGTAGIGALSRQSADAWHSWYGGDRNAPMPYEHLADFATLLKRARKKGFTVGVTQIKDIMRLHSDFRNNFSHFTPKSWSIEKAGLPRIVNTTLEAVEQLMARDEVNYKMTGNRKRRLAKAIIGAKSALARL